MISNIPWSRVDNTPWSHTTVEPWPTMFKHGRRWKTMVPWSTSCRGEPARKANTNCSHQIQIAHIKYKILTSNTNCSHQIQITHIKYKLLTSKTRLNGQRSENENYVQFSLGLDPTAILVLHVVLWSRRDVLQQLRQKCWSVQLL